MSLITSFQRILNSILLDSSCSVAKSYPTLQTHGLYVAHQASLSFVISQSLFRFMSIELVMAI